MLIKCFSRDKKLFLSFYITIIYNFNNIFTTSKNINDKFIFYDKIKISGD